MAAILSIALLASVSFSAPSRLGASARLAPTRALPHMGVGAAPFGTPADFRDTVERALSSITKKHVALLGSTGSIGTQVGQPRSPYGPHATSLRPQKELWGAAGGAGQWMGCRRCCAIPGRLEILLLPTLDIIREYGSHFEVISLSAGGNVELLAKQIAEFKPKVVGLAAAEKEGQLRDLLRAMGVSPMPASASSLPTLDE
ncbi:hypothetical protein T492DRAFT_835551 [Pavlovales sp. CCMP2436]|nr:hypothetical protein T492DRAFT_835551 [Pavlovales sp. CCMP2436]